MKGGNFRSETWFPHFHAGDKTAGGNNSSSLLLLEGRESLRSSQCSLHTVKDPAGALASPAYGTCYNLSLSPLIIANQQRAFYATVIWDYDLWTWHRLWLVDMAQDNSCPLFGPDRLCKILRQNLRACTLSWSLWHSINSNQYSGGGILLSLLSSSIQSWCALNCKEGFSSMEQ